MREEYSKAINLLTINEENRLEEKVTELERKQDEISLLKYQHEMAMKKVFDATNAIRIPKVRASSQLDSKN